MLMFPSVSFPAEFHWTSLSRAVPGDNGVAPKEREFQDSSSLPSPGTGLLTLPAGANDGHPKRCTGLLKQEGEILS